VIETGLKFIITVDYNKFKEVFQQRRKPGNQPKKEIKTDFPKATTNNSPTEGDHSVSFTEKVLTDDKRAIPEAVKDSTDGN
jgi:hypothetical protein